MKLSAILSDCNLYRYALHRAWDESLPEVLFIGLNPSTADADVDDNTSRVCINYAKRWGYGGLWMGNLFAFRSTDPEGMKRAHDPIGPDNDSWLQYLQAKTALVVCAWGGPGGFMDRDKQVLSRLTDPYCLVQLRSGRPGHPLYKSSELTPVRMTSLGTAGSRLAPG